VVVRTRHRAADAADGGVHTVARVSGTTAYAVTRTSGSPTRPWRACGPSSCRAAHRARSPKRCSAASSSPTGRA
jgi:hypothetical protein